MKNKFYKRMGLSPNGSKPRLNGHMKKKLMISAAALLLIGAGAIYAFGGGAIRFGPPMEEQLDTAIHQSVESTAQKTAEELEQTAASQAEEIEALRSQVEQLSDALAQSEELVTPSSAPDVNIVQVSSPTSAESKPAVAESKPAPVPPAPPAKVQNAGTVFEGYTVTVTDGKTPAVRAGGIDWPISKYYFFDANGNSLGSISGAAMNAIMDKYKIIGQGGSVDAPGSNGDWEFWFAEKFNEYRGLSGSSGGVSDNKSSTAQPKSPFNADVDTDAYADEVVTLINQKRENKGLNALVTDDSLMSHSATRAEELSVQYSHVRPNGTKEKSECIVMRRDTPAAAVQAWMDSDPHRDAIINESGRFNYSTIGSGCYQDKAGVLYWVITFGGYNSKHSETSVYNTNSEDTHEKGDPTIKYSISESELHLTAGDGHQLSVVSSGSESFDVAWSGSSIGKDTLSIDDTGYITTFHRSGMSSAKATLTVTAKIYVSDRLVKTLNCKVTVTQ